MKDSNNYFKRLKSDPWFFKVFKDLGQSGVEDAGFFDDGYTIKDLEKIHQDIKDPITPFSQIAQNQLDCDPENQIVLFSTGGFAPIHLGHLNLLMSAKKSFESEGQNVVGAFIIPDHDQYISYKLTRTNQSETMPAEERIKLIQLAINSYGFSDWLFVDPYPSRMLKSSINYPDIYKRLKNYLEYYLSYSPEFCYVFGEDNQGFAPACQKNNLRYFCGQRSPGSKFHKISSTGIRAGDQNGLVSLKGKELGQCPEELEKYITNHVFSDDKKDKYLIRNDFKKATEHLDVSDESCAQFVENLKSALSEYFSVEEVKFKSQEKIFQSILKKGPTISIDSFLYDQHRLSVSRVFSLDGSQLTTMSLESRPEEIQTLKEQVKCLPPGKYQIVDDDIASGYTIRKIQKALEKTDIEITNIALFSDSTREDVLEIGDAKDFLIGTLFGGLVIRFYNKKEQRFVLARVPYIYPFVSLSSRAKIPVDQEKIFSEQILDLNHQFYKDNNLNPKVEEMPAPAARFYQQFYPEAETTLDVIDVFRSFWK